MKSMRICFAGLVVFFLLASCNLRTGQLVDLPTSTITTTPTMTVPPSTTPLPTPTRRATFVTFLTATRGPSVTPMPVISPIPSDIVLTIQAKITEAPRGNGLPTGPFTCKFLSAYPDPGAVLRPKEGFEAIWRVRNVGKLNWTTHDVAFFHISGENFEYKTYKEDFIPYVVNVKDQLNLHVPMHAPRAEGLYSAVWGLRSKTTKQFFCTLSIIIQVVAPKK